MTLEDRISDVLTGIGFREIAVEPVHGERQDGCYRVTCAAPLEDGKISGSLRVEKLTWMTLPGGRDLRVQELEVRDRTDDTLRIGMSLKASRPAPAL